MNAQFRDGPNTGGSVASGMAKFVKRMLKGVLPLLVVLAWVGQSQAWFGDFCLQVDKYVSTNGLAGPFVKNSVTTVNPDVNSVYRTLSVVPGVNNVPAATVNIPTAFFGGPKVTYKFVITNCGKKPLYKPRFDDCVDLRSVGTSGFLQGTPQSCSSGTYLVPQTRGIASILNPGESVTVTSANFPLDPITTVDICGQYGHDRTNGLVRNNSRVRANGDVNGDGTAETVFYSEDLNLVQCKEFTPSPAALGDRVWQDLNGNGIQDCQDTNNNGIIGDAGDTGAECNAGISGVIVNLVNCQDNSKVLASTTTDTRGFYLFDRLNPGQYCVQFVLGSVPASTCSLGSPQFTTQNVGSNDAIDSDANTTTGVAPAVTLVSGQTNRTVDAGIICKGCPVAVDKKCVVQPPAPPSGFVCSAAKPIDSLTMIWTGQDGIFIKAWKGAVGTTTLLSTQGPINNGDKVTVSGMGGSPLDQFWEIFAGPPDPSGSNRIGISEFHISCSDVDMNGPEDCGKLEGNAKTTGTSLINLWVFDGMSGNGQTLTCTPTTQTGQDACSFVAGPAPSCQSLGAKPKTLTFRFTGSDCSASKNSQASDKWFCSGTPGTNPTVTVVKDPTKITVTPTTTLKVGDLVTVSTIGTDMGTEIQLQVGGQSVKIHTSCSQPLAVGDVFGSLELVQFNGQGVGAQVTYSYNVKNNGTAPVDLTSVFDDKLGELLGQRTTVAAGGTLTLNKTALISQTTTNKVTATARFAGTNTVCAQASDQLKVTVTKPACTLTMTFNGRTDNSVKFNVKNTSGMVITLDTFMLKFPTSYGAIKEIRLDGSIFKSSATVPTVGSGVTIGATGWTNPDLSKRQLDPGETRTLEVLFTKKGVATGWAGMTDLGGITFREGCQMTFPPVR